MIPQSWRRTPSCVCFFVLRKWFVLWFILGWLIVLRRIPMIHGFLTESFDSPVYCVFFIFPPFECYFHWHCQLLPFNCLQEFAESGNDAESTGNSIAANPSFDSKLMWISCNDKFLNVGSPHCLESSSIDCNNSLDSSCGNISDLTVL